MENAVESKPRVRLGIVFISLLIIAGMFSLGIGFYFGQEWLKYRELSEKLIAGNPSAVRPLSLRPAKLQAALDKAGEGPEPPFESGKDFRALWPPHVLPGTRGRAVS